MACICSVSSSSASNATASGLPLNGPDANTSTCLDRLCARSALAASALSHFGDQLDLDARAERNLRDAEGRARMLAALAENVGEQLGCAVGHEMLLGEVERRVDEAHHLDDACHAVQVADVRVQRRDEVDRDGARRGA